MTTITVQPPAITPPAITVTVTVAEAEATLAAAGIPFGATTGPAPTTVGEITDTAGNQWSINAVGQVAVIPAGQTVSVPDTTTMNVVALAYFEPKMFQLNKSGGWWESTVYPAKWVSTTSPFSSTTAIASTA
jgi:hypothetical protein